MKTSISKSKPLNWKKSKTTVSEQLQADRGRLLTPKASYKASYTNYHDHLFHKLHTDLSDLSRNKNIIMHDASWTCPHASSPHVQVHVHLHVHAKSRCTEGPACIHCCRWAGSPSAWWDSSVGSLAESQEVQRTDEPMQVSLSKPLRVRAFIS